MFLNTTLFSLLAAFLLELYPGASPSLGVDWIDSLIKEEDDEEFVAPDRGTPGRLEGAGTRNEGTGNSQKVLAMTPHPPTPDDERDPADLGCDPDTEPFDPPGEDKPGDTVGLHMMSYTPIEPCL